MKEDFSLYVLVCSYMILTCTEINLFLSCSALRDLEIQSQEEKERHAHELEAVRESIQSQARQEELDLMTAEAEKYATYCHLLIPMLLIEEGHQNYIGLILEII